MSRAASLERARAREAEARTYRGEAHVLALERIERIAEYHGLSLEEADAALSSLEVETQYVEAQGYRPDLDRAELRVEANARAFGRGIVAYRATA